MTSRFSILKKILLGFGALLGGIIALFAGLVLVIYLKPHFIWSAVQRYVLPADLSVTWQDITVSGHRAQGLHWDIEFDISGLKITKKNPRFEALIDQVKLVASVSFLSPGTRIVAHEFLVKSASPIRYWASGATEQDEKNFYQMITEYTDYVDQARSITFLENILIDIKQIEFYQSAQSAKPSAKPMRIQIAIDKKIDVTAPITFFVELRDISDTVEVSTIRGEARLDRFGTTDPFLVADIKTDGTGLKINAPLTMLYSEKGTELQTQAEIRYRLEKKWLVVTPDITAAVDSKNARLVVASAVEGLPGPIPKIQNMQLNLNLPLAKDRTWSSEAADFRFTAPIAVPFIDKKLRRTLGKAGAKPLPQNLDVELKGRVWFDPLLQGAPNKSQVFDGTLAVNSMDNAFFALDLGASAKIFKHRSEWLTEPVLNSHLTIKDFQIFRKWLAGLKIMIPAPLNVLNGTIAVHAKSPVGVRVVDDVSQIDTKIQVEVDLKSKTQIAKINGEALVNTDSRFKAVYISVNSLIEQLQLELPPLEPTAGVPALSRDSRFLMAPKQKKSSGGIKFYFDFDVETASPGAIKLLSKLASPHVPVTISVHKDKERPLTGFIKLEPFKVTYLRRTLGVDSLKINLIKTVDDDFPVTGDFHVQQTEYLVKIHISGTTGSPKITLSSEPYLDREDIISVLLYDRPRSQLVGGDSETVGNVQAAIADRAIGLFGIWAFANTPIRNVSYNPVTKVYSATVVLGNGITAGIGTGTDQATSLELRKRITNRWVITASLVPNEDDEKVGAIVLQWEKRF